MKNNKTIITLASVLLLAGVLTGCGKNPTAPQSTLQVNMKTSSSNVTAQAVIQTLPEGGLHYYNPEVFTVKLMKIEISQDGKSWETLWTGSQQYDIAAGQAIDPMNGPVVLPEGEYRGIKFTIGDNITGQIHVDGELIAGTLGDYEGDHLFSTINGKLSKPIIISGGSQTSVTFDFDITNTLCYNADGGHWSFKKPVVTTTIN